MNLRIPDRYHAKTLKKHTSLIRFASYFHKQTVFQKCERSFFDQTAIDAKSVLTFENGPLVAELKSIHHQKAVFKCQYTFSFYGHLVKKATRWN